MRVPFVPVLGSLAPALLLSLLTGPAIAQTGGKPVKALVITGGCCHNYEAQSQALTQGISKSVKVEWTVVNEGGRSTRGQIALYDTPNWAKPYDIVIHNECFADTTDEAYIRKITAAHRGGVPAIVIHCAMHTYRAAPFDDWREFLGVTTRRHTAQARHAVKIAANDHPAMKGFRPGWVTPMDELYVIEKLWPNAKALAVSVSPEDQKEYPVAWVNEYGGTRVFGTTFGHGDATFGEPAFIDLLTRGFRWAAKVAP